MISRLQPLFTILCIASFLSLSACIPPRVDNRGHVDAFDRMEEVVVGVSEREDVRDMLGSPSVTNNFGDEIWYYISKRNEAVAFLEPEVTAQTVTRIAFDGSGIVTSVQSYDENDSMDVAITEDFTPTEGQELGFMEQILGNVGRFNGGDRQPNLMRQ